MATLVVHSREDISLALTTGTPLATTPDSACYHGAELMRIWQEAAGDTPLLVGAGHDAALAHALIAAGIRDIYSDVPDAMRTKLAALASASGTRLHEDYPRDAVDMRCPEWEKQKTK